MGIPDGPAANLRT